MKTSLRVSGLKELEGALLELKTATAKRLVKRNMMSAAAPMADKASALAPDDPATGGADLHSTITASPTLSRRQRRLARKASKSDVEVYVGPAPLPHAHLQEFGAAHHAARPFLRPAFDQEKSAFVETVKDLTWADISKTAARNRNKV